jgi:hypothetical protein
LQPAAGCAAPAAAAGIAPAAYGLGILLLLNRGARLLAYHPFWCLLTCFLLPLLLVTKLQQVLQLVLRCMPLLLLWLPCLLHLLLPSQALLECQQPLTLLLALARCSVTPQCAAPPQLQLQELACLQMLLLLLLV